MTQVHGFGAVVGLPDHVANILLSGPCWTAPKVPVPGKMGRRDPPQPSQWVIAMDYKNQFVVGENRCNQVRERPALDNAAIDGSGEHLSIDRSRWLDSDAELNRRITLREAGEPAG